MNKEHRKQQAKRSLELDVAALRERLGPAKVRLIEQWIREVNGPLDQLIAAAMKPDAHVLDAGCSRGDPDLPSMYTGRYVVGTDMDLLGLRANHLASNVVLAPLQRLPFPDAAFDVVVCKWVVEHLREPQKDFAEIARVLKPGGTLVLLTPNAHSLFTFISRLLPYRVKQIMKGKLFQGHEEDTFRTWYRANTVTRLNALLRDAGFERNDVRLLPGMWTFFIFSEKLALLVRWLEWRQVRVPVIQNTTTYIAGAWTKRHLS